MRPTLWRFLAAALVLAPLAAAQVPEEQQEALRKMADNLQPTVEKIRGLKFKHEVPKGIKSKEELQAFMVQEFDREMTAEEWQKIQKVAGAIGLIEPDLDLRTLMIDLMTEQVAGFYNPATKRLYLIARGDEKSDDPMVEMQRRMLKMMGTSEDEIYMSHELVHALEDQHFDLLMLDLEQLDDDRITASKSLIEGTATVAMFEFLAAKMGMDPSVLRDQNPMGDENAMGGGETLAKAPEWIKQSLVFPYSGGMKFVQAVLDEGGWERVNEVYSDPPSSTEQILHPEKFVGKDRDQPTLITIPDLSEQLGEGWTLVDDNVLGELNLRILLTEALGKAEATKAAAGWDGDTYAVYEGPEGQLAYVHYTTWDSVEESEEFFKGYKKHLLRRFPATEKADESANRAEWRVGDLKYDIVFDGPNVHAIIGFPSSESILHTLFRSEKKEHAGGLPDVPKIELRTDDEPGPADAPPSAGDLGWETPAGWARKDGETLTHPSGARITIKQVDLPEMEEETLLDHVVGALPDRYEDFELVSRKPRRLAGRIVRTIRFRGTEDGTVQVFEQAIFKVGETAVLITYATPRKDLAATEAGWKAFQESLRFGD